MISLVRRLLSILVVLSACLVFMGTDGWQVAVGSWRMADPPP
jgi:hypothetical protein